MTNNMLRKRKAPQFIISSLFIFFAVAGMLSSCNAVTSEVDFTLTTKVENPTEELTLVPETEVATQMPTIITLTSEPTKTKTLEPTVTATEIPTPTIEKSLIEGNIFFDPQSEADFDKVVESPSPIDEPEKFAAWQDEYLEMVEEKLETYIGSSVDSKQVGIEYYSGSFSMRTKELLAISSYKFNWQEQEILTKTFVINDGIGNLVPISITYTTSNSEIFDSNVKYMTPPE